jgi:hypothetical protein
MSRALKLLPLAGCFGYGNFVPHGLRELLYLLKPLSQPRACRIIAGIKLLIIFLKAFSQIYQLL